RIHLGSEPRTGNVDHADDHREHHTGHTDQLPWTLRRLRTPATDRGLRPIRTAHRSALRRRYPPMDLHSTHRISNCVAVGCSLPADGTSATYSTLLERGPTISCFNSSCNPSAVPRATTSTLPSGKLRAYPTKP